jgi:hypothetical protein
MLTTWNCPQNSPQIFRAAAVLALAQPRAQIQPAGVRKRDGRLRSGPRSAGTTGNQMAQDGRDGQADWAGVLFVQVLSSGVGWPWRADGKGTPGRRPSLS